MIHQVLNHIAFELNQHLRRASIAGEDIVVLANPVDTDGKPDQLTANKVILFLAGIERDTFPGRANDSSQMLARNAPTFLNLHIVIAASFTGRSYPEALKYLSRVIAFFQQFPILDRNTSPGLDPAIEKLLFDMENLDRRELNNLWGMFGGKYMPSVLYRIRMVSIDANSVTGRVNVITDPHVGTHPASGN